MNRGVRARARPPFLCTHYFGVWVYTGVPVGVRPPDVVVIVGFVRVKLRPVEYGLQSPPGIVCHVRSSNPRPVGFAAWPEPEPEPTVAAADPVVRGKKGKRRKRKK